MSIEAVWESEVLWARVVRAVLTPTSWVFGAGVSLRNALYDAGVLRSVAPPIPTVSIGNLSVGGTGKTPVAAYVVRRLREQGRTPAIVMRGYGGDEVDVHRHLNPGLRVYAAPDRVAGITRAASEGADVAVLDDAFQHRRAGRTLDIVLIGAERWFSGAHARLLPAGVLREGPRALRRASLVIVTHKVAGADVVQRVSDAVRAVVPDVPLASIHCGIGVLCRIEDGGARHALVPLSALAGARVLAVAGVGDPASFFAQLAAVGALVTPVRFPDHHAYTTGDIAALQGAASGHKYIVVTLKDAVKLRRAWPAKGPPLWYVSQAVEVSGGASFIDTALVHLLSH